MDTIKINTIKLFKNSMLDYQKQNNIKNNCMTNVQILYDMVNANYPELQPKAKAVFCHYVEKDDVPVFYTHLILEINCENIMILEPSYDVAIKIEMLYFENYNNLKKYVRLQDVISDNEIKDLLQNFDELQNTADNINKGIFQISSFDYYNNILDYVSKHNSFVK